MKPITAKYSVKKYKCQECGHEKEIGTNHWGECYSFGNYNTCPTCPPYKRPNTWICCEKPPKGYGKPKPWKKVKLSDIATVKKVS